MYQQVNLRDMSLVGSPGPVPDLLRGLSDEDLADLSQSLDPPPEGLANQGFWPVTVTTPVDFDPRRQVASIASQGTPDSSTRTVVFAQTVRNMSIAEFAASNPGLVSLPRWRFYLQAAVDQLMSGDEAAAGAAGVVPAAMATAILSLPAETQLAARVLLAGLPAYDVTSELVPVFAAAQRPQLSESDVTKFWVNAHALTLAGL